jgi:DNA polymerase IV
MQRIILHIDMDAFFAAIEQLDHPEFRGKPVVVGADPKEGKGRGVVSTCSYEARTFGIHSAMPINEAYKRCPHAIYVWPRGKRYSEASRQIMGILEAFSPDIEQISIDEAFLDISSTYKIYGSPEKLAQEIKRRIRDEVHLTSSVGIAPSKFVAKIASDLKKPDGLVIVHKDGVKAFLHPLKISRLWGVGNKTLPRLQRLGIYTIGDLADYSQKELTQKFGQSGQHYFHLANGIDARNVEGYVAAKSISKEVTFGKDLQEDEAILGTLRYLSNELAREMRRKDYRGRTVTLKIRLQGFETFTRSRTVDSLIDHFDDLFKTICLLYGQFDRHGARVRLVGVGVSNLHRGESQLELFADEPESSTKVDDVLDKVREKFGEKAITRASLLDNQHDS